MSKGRHEFDFCKRKMQLETPNARCETITALRHTHTHLPRADNLHTRAADDRLQTPVSLALLEIREFVVTISCLNVALTGFRGFTTGHVLLLRGLLKYQHAEEQLIIRRHE